MIADKVNTLRSCLLRLPKSLPLTSESPNTTSLDSVLTLTGLNRGQRGCHQLRAWDHIRFVSIWSRSVHSTMQMILTCDLPKFFWPLLYSIVSQKKNKREKPIVKWQDMQKTIHGMDDIVMSNLWKSSPKEKPPVLECSDENQPELGQESKPDSKMVLNQSTNGLTWLDGLLPNLDGVRATL